ncbi:type IV conjugative transfer system protein TraE [Enterovibrio paralichthyis]|uniref:type IV conjugative transfer system protein TraE n=1 Tax=Enterovibrio paralichthyis TaxID=2853805 RepID=UPI001C49413B|nr:type IV conjugative transfer system protein TraE [Enterovibrio paralichthyis]MBV7300267.1 type IV conjugative transfer system protein TraE [Enterovibrio paralichthyis]
MDANHTNQDARRTKVARNAFFVLCALAQIGLIVCLIVMYQIAGKEKIVVQPQFISDNCHAWVTSFGASECYLEGLAMGDALALYNLTPSNGKLVQTRILRRTHPSFHNEMKRWVFQQVKDIREKNYVFALYVNDVIADEPTQTVYVKGVLSAKKGATDLPDEAVTLAFRYTSVNGEALITRFYEKERPTEKGATL